MSVSRLDKFYRKILLNRFFVRGWGNPDHILRLVEFRKLISNRIKCITLVPEDSSITILTSQKFSTYEIIEGKFTTPLAKYLPDIVIPEIRDAHFELIVPLEWESRLYRPLCIHLAGTGDHRFWKRRSCMAKPLLKHNMASLLLENPFYGLRKPKTQYRSSLHNVSDIFVMGGCLVLECLVLLQWCENLGFGPLGISGVSMGGHMASLAACNWPKPLVLVPCLSTSTASGVFTEGVMSESINWDLLQKQFKSNRQFYNVLSKLCTIVDDPFECNLTLLSDLSIPQGIYNFKKSLTSYDLINLVNRSHTHSLFSSVETTSKDTSMVYILKNLLNEEFLKDPCSKKHSQEAVWFMKGIMDEFTHLKNFSPPIDTSLIIAICAKRDGYIPSKGFSKLEEVWPSATIRYVDSGHVGAYICYLSIFRHAILEAFERAKLVCPPPQNPK
ncbi:hypothetical protein FQA39_LY15486 [Lamprigera yunnana]|nr:hypothetical protein FQA39_LY15486 [Lamprigera yunnana]